MKLELQAEIAHTQQIEGTLVNSPGVDADAYEKAREEGYQEGISEGYNSGKQDGLTEGYNSGKQDGLNEGYKTGKQDGLTEGYNSGKQDGLTEGYNSGYVSGIVAGKKFGYDDGFSEGLITGQERVPFKTYQINVANDVISGKYTFLEENDFVINNCHKPGFMIQIISLQYFSEGYGIAYGYNGNRQIMQYSTYNPNYGIQVNRTPSGNNVKCFSNPCTSANGNGIPYVNENGDVLISCNNTNSTLRKGNYLVILSIA